jgi:hypothetical protein
VIPVSGRGFAAEGFPAIRPVATGGRPNAGRTFLQWTSEPAAPAILVHVVRLTDGTFAMTVPHKRPGPLGPRPVTVLDELTELADRLCGEITPAARPAARALYREASGAYARIVDGGTGIDAEQHARVRAAARALVAAGGSPDAAADHLAQMMSHLVEFAVERRRSHCLSTVVRAGNLVLRELLVGARNTKPEPARRDLVSRLIAGEVPPGIEHELAAAYDVVVLRPSREVATARLAELVDEFETLGPLGASLDAGVVLLVPTTLDYPPARAAEHWAERLGESPWCASARRPLERIASGYEEASDILTLALAAGRPPGVFGLDDFLIEYAVLRQSAVADSLSAIVKPVLGNEMLRETLAVLIESDFNRNEAAQALYIHRSTLDYRIRRIEEATGHNPMSGRGAQVLTVAMTACAATRMARRTAPSPGSLALPGFTDGKRCSQ